MANEYTAEDMKFLTPEEIAAIENDAGDEGDIIKNIAESADNEEDGTVIKDDAANTSDDASAKVKADAVNDTAQSENQDQGKEADTAVASETAQPEDTKPLYKSDAVVADSQAKRAELSAEKSTALAKLLEGEISAAQYSAIDTRVQSELSQLEREETIALTKAEVSAEMTQQQLVRAWESEVLALSKQAKTEGLDYTDPKIAGEFNTLIRVFGQEAVLNGMSDDNLAASKWALAQAHSTMKIRHGVASQTQTSNTQAETQVKIEPRHNIKALGALPVADAPKVDSDPVARFATLDGEDLERALAKMSPDEIESMLERTL